MRHNKCFNWREHLRRQQPCFCMFKSPQSRLSCKFAWPVGKSTAFAKFDCHTLSHFSVSAAIWQTQTNSCPWTTHRKFWHQSRSPPSPYLPLLPQTPTPHWPVLWQTTLTNRSSTTSLILCCRSGQKLDLSLIQVLRWGLFNESLDMSLAKSILLFFKATLWHSCD